MTLHPSRATPLPTQTAAAPLSLQLQRLDGEPGDIIDSGLAPLGSDDTACGMPAERHARLAAQRAFVALKLSFVYVVDSLPGQQKLQQLVQLAEAPHELWALRASVFGALTGDDPQHRRSRQLLNRSLDSMFLGSRPQLN